ncbi:hypothetical protein [uncultured Desulfovibrio sp.]|uniref:hypothetical protein n=1 Tax=uncultured Desulfovibrio sp. TaxID=167968 RepID=UPI00260474C5|nr:hypothetical protein [uncultured Desulfovibrio sp.]
MNDRQRKRTLSCKGVARAVFHSGRLVRTLPLLALLLALTACARGGVAPSAFGGGSGTKSDPYLIATEAYLRDIAAAPQLYKGKYFLQTADIKLNGDWKPIGDAAYYREFSGRFDGNGHRITGLTIREDSNGCGSLFGFIGYGGEVRNLIVETSPEGVAPLDWDTRVGIIAAFNRGLIENCITRGRVVNASVAGGTTACNDGTVKNCVNHTVIASNGVCSYFSAGGIAGEISDVLTGTTGLITGCTNYGSITAESNAGGIVAENIGTVQDCVNHGPVSAKGSVFGIYAGGVAGTNRTLIARCRNTGTIRASGLGSGLIKGKK